MLLGNRLDAREPSPPDLSAYIRTRIRPDRTPFRCDRTPITPSGEPCTERFEPDARPVEPCTGRVAPVSEGIGPRAGAAARFTTLSMTSTRPDLSWGNKGAWSHDASGFPGGSERARGWRSRVSSTSWDVLFGVVQLLDWRRAPAQRA